MLLQSILKALKEEIPAKAEVKGNLDTYKYYDNVSMQHRLQAYRSPVRPANDR